MTCHVPDRLTPLPRSTVTVISPILRTLFTFLFLSTFLARHSSMRMFAVVESDACMWSSPICTNDDCSRRPPSTQSSAASEPSPLLSWGNHGGVSSRHRVNGGSSTGPRCFLSRDGLRSRFSKSAGSGSVLFQTCPWGRETGPVGSAAGS
ncbi:hypothetical protein BC827DRAFT_56706 [Russula dissimulans]|nr:hypothetical protein BC827DRAFT_56706 [Russula dissimulans]